MDFDGVVGWIEWEGDLTAVLPWLQAVEVLHVGQKATFGLGRLEVIEPDRVLGYGISRPGETRGNERLLPRTPTVWDHNRRRIRKDEPPRAPRPSPREVTLDH